jgi:hypothetical protein
MLRNISEVNIMAAPKMEDYPFEQLERLLYHSMKRLKKLQKKYRGQTGKDFVPSKPLPKPDMPDSFNPCKNNQGCFLPRY